MATNAPTVTAPPRPRAEAPPLEVDTLGDATWRLSDQRPRAFTMIVFYRGLHCPVCRGYLRDLDRRLDDFAARGVEVIAVSGDARERAEQSRREWELEKLELGYGQTVESMRAWGLFVSEAVKDTEPGVFAEPGLFLVNPAGSVFYAAVNSMPWGRPSFGEILKGVEFVTAHDYPARGEA